MGRSCKSFFDKVGSELYCSLGHTITQSEFRISEIPSWVWGWGAKVDTPRAKMTVQTDFARVVRRWGVPPLWAREPGFATLLHIILEQQVSLASARAAMERLVAAIGQPRPTTFLELSDEELFAIGFSRQKRGYARALARRILDGEIDLDELEGLSDSAARQRLMAQRGIGPWTADIYLLACLGRADVFPARDLALQEAARVGLGLAVRPSAEELLNEAELWRPWRSVAAVLLWAYYRRIRREITGSDREQGGTA